MASQSSRLVLDTEEQRRQRSIVLFGLQELPPPASETESRREDHTAAIDIARHLGIEDSLQVRRINGPEGSRPMMITFETEESKKLILKRQRLLLEVPATAHLRLEAARNFRDGNFNNAPHQQPSSHSITSQQESAQSRRHGLPFDTTALISTDVRPSRNFYAYPPPNLTSQRDSDIISTDVPGALYQYPPPTIAASQRAPENASNSFVFYQPESSIEAGSYRGSYGRVTSHRGRSYPAMNNNQNSNSFVFVQPESSIEAGSYRGSYGRVTSHRGYSDPAMNDRDQPSQSYSYSRHQ